jgi:hypothetical protein
LQFKVAFRLFFCYNGFMNKLYLIERTDNWSYDDYDSVVVCAESEDEARLINPDGEWGQRFRSWCATPDQVKVTYIGVAGPLVSKGVVLASFNAG